MCPKFSYPPVTQHGPTQDLMMEALNTVLQGTCPIYVSMPMTTGKSWLQRSECCPALQDSTTVAKYEREVIALNIEKGNRFVSQLRNVTSQPLINPLALPDIANWAQDDYRHFWATVIKKFATKAVFADEWQYSAGCSYEFLIAMAKNIPTLTSRLTPIAKVEGQTMINEAILEMKAVGLDCSFLVAVADDLNKLVSFVD